MSRLVAAFVISVGMLVIEKDAIQNVVTHTVVEDSSKLALSVLSQVYSLSFSSFTEMEPSGLGSPSFCSSRLHLILPSIFILQAFLPWRIQLHACSSWDLMPLSKENRTMSHSAVGCVLNGLRPGTELRHPSSPWGLCHSSRVEQVQMPLARAPSEMHQCWSGSRNDSGGHNKLSTTVLAFNRHKQKSWVCVSFQATSSTYLAEN